MLRTDDSAAYASNWRSVLAVDGSVGVAVSVFGVWLAVAVNLVVGTLFIALGAAYTAMVGGRARRWRRLRRERDGQSRSRPGESSP